jgi:hypothetical protein
MDVADSGRGRMALLHLIGTRSPAASGSFVIGHEPLASSCFSMSRFSKT